MNWFKFLLLFVLIGFLSCRQNPVYHITPHSPEQEGVTAGKYIPNFNLLDSTMQYQPVEKWMGKATIIDFWASWCRPCREAANPAYKKLYLQYHSKGLQIIGISSDRHQYFWKKALKQDSLPWYQAIDSTHLLLKKFQVKSIPGMLLIDQNGRIIGRNLWGADLAHKIDSLLQQ